MPIVRFLNEPLVESDVVGQRLQATSTGRGAAATDHDRVWLPSAAHRSGGSSTV